MIEVLAHPGDEHQTHMNDDESHEIQQDEKVNRTRHLAVDQLSEKSEQTFRSLVPADSRAFRAAKKMYYHFAARS